MADKPIVVTVPSLRGAEYGFASLEVAREIFPDCEPVRFQDGTAYEEPKKPAPKKDAPKKDAKTDG